MLDLLQLDLYKIVSICADGASVMQGHHKGVVTQLKRLALEARKCNQKLALLDAARKGTHKRMFLEFHASAGILCVHCVFHRCSILITLATSRPFLILFICH